MAQAVSAELRRARQSADAFLYPLERLTSTERRTLAASPAASDPGVGVIAVRPAGLRVYRDGADLRGGNDSLCRVVAMPGPGAGPLGAAAFAREIARALNEPVLTTATNYDVEDLKGEVMGLFSTLLADNGAAFAKRRETAWLRHLLDEAAPGVRLIVGHGLGAWIASKAIVLAEVTPARPRRLASFGAAPPAAAGSDDFAVIGAADPYGWSLTDAAAPIWETPIGVGHHLNPVLIGRLDVAHFLRAYEAEAPLLTRRDGPRPARSLPPSAVVVD